MTDSAHIVIAELDRLIEVKRRELEAVTGDLAEWEHRHGLLVNRRASISATLDALTEFRDGLAPMPEAQRAAAVADTFGQAVAEAEADPMPEAPRVRAAIGFSETRELLAVTCPRCGAGPNKRCDSLGYAKFHAERWAVAIRG